MEKVDAVTLAAMVEGDEDADFDVSRRRLMNSLNAPFPRAKVMDTDEAELRQAVGLPT